MAKQDDFATSPGADPTFTPPGLVPRLGALIVDWALCLLVAGTFSDPMRQGWPPVVVLVAEYGFFVGLFAQTPGMWLTRLRCVSFADGGPIGVPRALLRGVLLCLVVPPLVMDERQRGLHDRAAGSVMVRAPRRAGPDRAPVDPRRSAR